MDLLKLIKSIPAENFADFGVAVAYTDIFTISGLNRDDLSRELRKLESSGKIKLCVNESHDANLIIAVKLV
ncbi:MAG: hypothetical protein LBI38_07450 [Oscillospiraceae bacterium]|jgi:hypothetical protein|nr:hypothetical protein [Oscillospiraceae bacterium]